MPLAYRITTGLALLVGLMLVACSEGAPPKADRPESQPDTTPPAWPVGSDLRVVSVGRTHAVFEWPAAQDDQRVARYRVFRDGALVSEVQGSTHMVTLLRPRVRYRFDVQAVDAAGNASGDGLHAEVVTAGVDRLPSVEALLRRLPR